MQSFLDMGRLLEPVDSKSQIASVEMYINRVEERSKRYGRNGEISRRYIRVSVSLGTASDYRVTVKENI